MKIFKYMLILIMLSYLKLNAVSLSELDIQPLLINIENKEYMNVDKFLSDNKYKNNPEYYVVLLKYTISKGTHTHTVRGFKGNARTIGTKIEYDNKLIINAITKTQKKLNNFNNRLDIHLDILNIAYQIKEWQIIENQLINVLKASKQINKKWNYGRMKNINKEFDDFIYNYILEHMYKLFIINNPKADNALYNSSLALIKYYPNLVYGYNNIGQVEEVKKKNYIVAKEYYTKALEINKNDKIMLENLRRINKKIETQK